MDDEMIKTLEEIVKAEKHMKEKFTKLAKSASTPEMRALFQELAHEEANHEKEVSEKLIALRLMRDE
jgi:rubrerythrin